MKMRKLFAGIAAAATMLGGLALGVTTASAAPAESGINVNHSVAGHTYTAYQFATFRNASTSGDTSYVEVETVAAYVDKVKAAADNADGAPDNSIPAEYANNPAAYVATFKATQLRTFAENLKASLSGKGAGSVEGNGETVNLNVSEGWYAVTDTYTNAQGVVQSGAVAVVATKVKDAANLTIKTPYEEGQVDITAPGEFNAKNEDVPPTPTKEVKKDDVDVNGKSANIGDVLDFTVTGTVPASASGYTTYKYTITDTASKGLKVAEASTFKVTTEDGTDIDSSKYAVIVTPNSETGVTVTTVVFANAKDYAGQKIVVKYQATVTDAILENADKVTNKATATTDKGTSGEGTTIVYTGGLKFHKYGVDNEANGLGGATFNVYAGTTVPQKADKTGDDTSKALKFTETKSSTAGSYKYDATSENIAVVSGANGDVELKGLAAGDYTIKEVGFKDGYATNFVPTFTITVSVDSKTGAVSYTLKEHTNNALGLATEKTVGGVKAIEVKNVKKITQLPVTGAAGTIMFSVVAVLLAGAAATVYAKSRNTKRMLNA